MPACRHVRHPGETGTISATIHPFDRQLLASGTRGSCRLETTMIHLPVARTPAAILLATLLAAGSLAPAFAQQHHDDPDRHELRSMRKEQRDARREQAAPRDNVQPQPRLQRNPVPERQENWGELARMARERAAEREAPQPREWPPERREQARERTMLPGQQRAQQQPGLDDRLQRAAAQQQPAQHAPAVRNSIEQRRADDDMRPQPHVVTSSLPSSSERIIAEARAREARRAIDTARGGDHDDHHDNRNDRYDRYDDRRDERISRDQQQHRIEQQRRQAADWQRRERDRHAQMEQRNRELERHRRHEQHRYQQDYYRRWLAQQARWNATRHDYYRDPYYYTAYNYRYNYGGRWYDTNRYGADLLRQAVRDGYREGWYAGRADRRDRWRFDYQGNFGYLDGSFGYNGYYVGLNDYRYYFRQGFRRGYEDAYYGRYRYGSYDRDNGWAIILPVVLTAILGFQYY